MKRRSLSVYCSSEWAQTHTPNPIRLGRAISGRGVALALYIPSSWHIASIAKRVLFGTCLH